MYWHPIKKDALGTTEIIAFKGKLTGQMIQLKAGAKSGSANTAPAEKSSYLPSLLGYKMKSLEMWCTDDEKETQSVIWLLLLNKKKASEGTRAFFCTRFSIVWTDWSSVGPKNLTKL